MVIVSGSPRVWCSGGGRCRRCGRSEGATGELPPRGDAGRRRGAAQTAAHPAPQGIQASAKSVAQQELVKFMSHGRPCSSQVNVGLVVLSE